jgi:hypothetical protein
MASLYFNLWSCTGCDYASKTISAPSQIKPVRGTPPAIIEYRWCNGCNAIQRIFTGKAKRIIPGEEPNSKIESDKWDFRTIEGFNKALENLENKKKRNFLFFITKDAQKLKNYHESKLICENLSAEYEDYYLKLNVKPRCLKCGSFDVSDVSFENDVHSCGGNFIRKNSDRVGFNTLRELVQYKSDGTATTEMRNIYDKNGDYAAD